MGFHARLEGFQGWTRDLTAQQGIQLLNEGFNGSQGIPRLKEGFNNSTRASTAQQGIQRFNERFNSFTRILWRYEYGKRQ
jgi:hypothetical protein